MQWPRWSEAVLALAVLSLAAGAGYVAGGRGSGGAGQLQVTARGTAGVTPQIALVNLGANTVGKTPAAALQELSSVGAALLRAVAKEGVAARDVQTSGLALGANWSSGKQSGYQASEQFRITVRKLSTLGPLIQDATAAGANQLNGVTMQSSDPNAGEQQAVAAALRSAKAQALSEAKELGVRLGPVRSVRIQSSGSPPIYGQVMMRAASAAPSIPVGTEQVTVTMQVTYSLR